MKRKNIYIKGELHSDYIFTYFTLIGLKEDSLTLFIKTNFFLLPKLRFQHHLHKKHFNQFSPLKNPLHEQRQEKIKQK